MGRTHREGDFEWDTTKAASNEEKHDVSFPEAVTAFYDEHSLIVDDPQGNEDRFVLIGMSSKARVLYVVHAEAVTKKRTRIISARVASKAEALQYTLGDVHMRDRGDEMPEIDFTKCRVVRRGPPRDRRLALATLRVSAGMTQTALAKRAAISQSEMSRLESREDCLVSTLRKYVEGLGGEFQVVAKIHGRKYPIALGGK